MKDTLEQYKSEDEFINSAEIQNESRKLQAKLNCGYHDAAESRKIVSLITNREIDETTEIVPPFFTDFGRKTVFGRNVFVNLNCTFMDKGGITIGDGTFIGPNVNLLTISHDFNPEKRNIKYYQPIKIEENVWIGASAIVLPGVTIGKGSIVGAGAVVTKDVPEMCVVAGNPARVIKKIDLSKAEEK